ncbi:MAG TPA: type II secretion system protein GspG [Blastocatellia bacterium]|nr:type II secretion system protein GspG [Blastocatellia bacterium]
METQEQIGKICSSCGARIAPSMRYCPSCYRKVSDQKSGSRHTESASEIETTHRHDPTLVFSPDAHEQIKQKAKLRKWLFFASITVFALFTITIFSIGPFKHYRAENKKAEDRFVQARKDMNMTAEALNKFKNDMGRYPTKDEGIRVLVEKPLTWTDQDTALYKKWSGPYIPSVREVDPWGNEYVYEPSDDNKSYRLIAVDPLKDEGKAVRVLVTSKD